jgi:hypothetical protein
LSPAQKLNLQQLVLSKQNINAKLPQSKFTQNGLHSWSESSQAYHTNMETNKWQSGADNSNSHIQSRLTNHHEQELARKMYFYDRNTKSPTFRPSERPSQHNSPLLLTKMTSRSPTRKPTRSPTRPPSHYPTYAPSKRPSLTPTRQPSTKPTINPTHSRQYKHSAGLNTLEKYFEELHSTPPPSRSSVRSTAKTTGVVKYDVKGSPYPWSNVHNAKTDNTGGELLARYHQRQEELKRKQIEESTRKETNTPGLFYYSCSCGAHKCFCKSLEEIPADQVEFKVEQRN